MGQQAREALRGFGVFEGVSRSFSGGYTNLSVIQTEDRADSL